MFRVEVQIGRTGGTTGETTLKWVECRQKFESIEGARTYAESIWCLDARIVDEDGKILWTLSKGE